MKPSRHSFVAAVAALALGSCDSKVETRIDLDAPAIQAVEGCLPNLYKWVGSLFEIAKAWRLQSGDANPAGMTVTVVGDSLDVEFVVDGVTIAMTIDFYGPGGVDAPLTSLSGLTTPIQLSDAIQTAADELWNLYPSPSQEKFVVGVWAMSGAGISASDEALTAIVGGSAASPELVSVSTTVSTVGSGVPAADASTVTDSGPPVCSLTFSTDGLLVDEDIGQAYPSGVIEVTLTTPDTTVDATITFDKTSTAEVALDGAPGSWSFDLQTRDLTYNL